MNPLLIEQTSGAAPSRGGARISTYLPTSAAGQTFGTNYFHISTVIILIIPMIELIIGVAYKGECPIDQRISTFMIVAGACGLTLVGLSLLLNITFMCFTSNSTVLTLAASCGICLKQLTAFIILIFNLIWFILGCIWVFRVYHRVQYDDPKQSNYCEPILYIATFTLLIVTLVWTFLLCCLFLCLSRLAARNV